MRRIVGAFVPRILDYNSFQHAVQIMPSKGIFEATIQYSKDSKRFSLAGLITCLNTYGEQNWCVNDDKYHCTFTFL